MPSPNAILGSLTAIANDWRWLAITCHILLGALLATLLSGWRPSVRLVGRLLVVPLFSVSLSAWLADNPFNGTVFAILAAVLVATTVGLPSAPIQLASAVWAAPGVALVVFGWTYPHFIRADSWATYLYASPFGVLPCPTLSTVIGTTLVFSNLGSTSWNTSLAGAGLVYGVIGVFGLGVVLDSALLFASAILGVAAARCARCARVVVARPSCARAAPDRDSSPPVPLHQSARHPARRRRRSR
jgi:hypothetical protein